MARRFNYVMGEPCASPMIKKRTCGGAIELNLVSKIEVFQDVEAGKAEPKHDKKKRQKISRHDAIFICKRNLSTVYNAV